METHTSDIDPADGIDTFANRAHNSDKPEEHDEVEPMAISKELLERERKYLERNKKIQMETHKVVKNAEAVVREGREILEAPLTAGTPMLSKAAEDSTGPSVGSKQSLLKTKAKTTRARLEVPTIPEDIDDENDGITSASVRILKSKISLMQQEINKLIQENAEKDSTISSQQTEITALSGENVRHQKGISSLTGQLEKLKKAGDAQKKHCDSLEMELSTTRKEIENAVKREKERELEVNAKDLRLNRALEDIEKLKQTVAKATMDSKDKAEASKKTADRLLVDNKRLEKQKAEILMAFKKQMQLIDVLKKQKIHIEAARMLQFTEDEFMKAMSFENE
ncbi:uncharacterized protein BJ171DRAFT_620706 [Polychytrium aggregatum]|uniref:uncharacterized protein n=1 Tax=Polychytrium aggregatum TaxID=110093 RepID=UPI0022FEF6A3|nr:uncharacterized protein BJ171DRAFT_620706 [Polychytrium aggregatum]KAI9209341.1 hypothetical protein BJ171DRAFT_620706 [Polychytrium aggregatum]